MVHWAAEHKPLNGESILISVMFNHDYANQFPSHSICYPTIGACGKLLALPVNHMKTSAEFNDIFFQHTMVANSLIDINYQKTTFYHSFIIHVDIDVAVSTVEGGA